MREAGRAKTPEDKKQVIARLLDVWLNVPDLRLGQLIGNAMGDLYWAEDEFLIRELEQYYEPVEEEA